ncbi:MAG: hypothetical protein KAR37_02790, partial [Alphaproteobacteria bacterium]|nr:hypothetical protein [Alphaproteobacteria bacterium]
MSTNVTKLPRSGRQGAARGAAGLHEAIEAERRAQRRATMIAAGASIAWVLFALVFIASNGSEGELAGLTLPEIAMLIAGVATPLAVIWLIVLFVRRNADLREHTEMLRRQLDLLTYPAEDAELHVRKIAESLRAQAEELNRVTDTATIQMEKLSKTLASRTDSLAEASESATGQAQTIGSLLEHHTGTLADLTERFHKQEAYLREAVEKQARDMTAATSN